MIELTPENRGDVPLEVTHLVEVKPEVGEAEPEFFHGRNDQKWYRNDQRCHPLTPWMRTYYRFARPATPTEIAAHRASNCPERADGSVLEVPNESHQPQGAPMAELNFKESVDLLKFWFDMEADEQADADKEDEDPEYKKVVRAATFVLSRVAAMEDLLCSARAICKRKGEETAWERFDDRIASFDIGCITPRVFKVLPSDVVTMTTDEFVERWTDKAIQDWAPQLNDFLSDLRSVKGLKAGGNDVH